MRVILLHAAAVLAPSSGITVSQWADAHRYLSPESGAKVGEWKSYPYQVEPMNAASDPTVHRVVLVSATQMIKTSVIENAIGRTIDVDPLPILVVQPRKEDAEDFVEERIDPMLRDTARLKDKIYKASRKLKKLFRGGMLSITSAGKAENAARRAIGLLCLDEVDRYRLTREGNFIVLARNRLETYKSRGKEIVASSPTYEGSEIDKAYQASDQREFFIPCPLCGEEQSMERKFRTQVRWDDSLPTNEQKALSARYHCEHCDQPWDEQQRRAAVERGRWVAKKPFCGVAGFKICALYSYSKRLDQIVLEFLQSKDSPEDFRGFVNTKLCENWAEQGEMPEWEKLVNRRLEYQVNDIPQGVLVATAGADVHPDRIEVEVLGHGRNRETWSLRYEIFHGRTSDLEGEAWKNLEALLAEVYPHPLGRDLPLSLLFVDSGNQSNDVYTWARKQPPSRVMAIKGQERGSLPVSQPAAVDVNVYGRKIRHGLHIRHVVGPFFKEQLYADLKSPEPTEEQLQANGGRYPAGYCHFPKGKNYGDEHFRQLCAEQLVTIRDKRGRVRREWQQMRARNEALDCRIYARAAGWQLGVDRLREEHWKNIEAGLTATLFNQPPPTPPAPAPAPAGREDPRREREQEAMAARPPQARGWVPPRPDWFSR